MIQLLQAKGYNVIAVQNPLSSLADDVAATKRVVAQMNGPVLLVGHSWAGMVISEAGNDPKVVGLVYISALVPEKGQSAADTTKGYPAAPGGAEIQQDAAGYLSMTRKGIDEDFVPELPAVERGIVYATQGPWNLAALSEKVLDPAWQSKPSRLIADAKDRMIPPQYEKYSAKKNSSEVDDPRRWSRSDAFDARPRSSRDYRRRHFLGKISARAIDAPRFVQVGKGVRR